MTIRILLIVCALLVPTLTPAQQLPPAVADLLKQLEAIGQEAGKILRPEPEPEPEPEPGDVIVKAGGDLQAALEKGGAIQLEAGAIYAGNFVVKQSGTVLRGHGATLQGKGGPALRVPPGVNNVRIVDLGGVTTSYSTVFLCGENGPGQTMLEQVPKDIVWENISVLTHRGRRALEINCTGKVLNPTIADVYDPALNDSQGIWISANTPGPFLIEGGSVSAASEGIMVGGDTAKIPGNIPRNITIRKTLIWKPLTWQTDGVRRAVKTGLEFKTCDACLVEDVTIRGSWRDGQDGWGVTITPRNGGQTTGITFRRVVMHDVSAGYNVTGRNVAGQLPTPARTTGIVVEGGATFANRTKYGGRGILAMLTMGVDTVDFIGHTFVGDGPQIVLVGDKERVGRLRFQDGNATAGIWGIQTPSGANAANWSTWIDVLDVTGNTITGATSAFRNNLPGNTWVDRAAFDLIVARRAR